MTPNELQAAIGLHGVTVAEHGGLCPVQTSGTVDGHSFYFRARGDRSLAIAAAGGDPVEVSCGDAAGWYMGDGGDNGYSGYMEDPEVAAQLREWITLFRSGHPGRRAQSTEEWIAAAAALGFQWAKDCMARRQPDCPASASEDIGAVDHGDAPSDAVAGTVGRGGAK